MRTKIAKVIAAFCTLLANATEMREVYKNKRLAFLALEKAEKRMTLKSVMELNCQIFEAADAANSRINSCNYFAVTYSRGRMQA